MISLSSKKTKHLSIINTNLKACHLKYLTFSNKFFFKEKHTSWMREFFFFATSTLLSKLGGRKCRLIIQSSFNLFTLPRFLLFFLFSF